MKKGEKEKRKCGGNIGLKEATKGGGNWKSRRGEEEGSRPKQM